VQIRVAVAAYLPGACLIARRLSKHVAFMATQSRRVLDLPAMLRILPVFLALIATVGGWFTVPTTAIGTGRDSASIAWIAKSQYRMVPVHGARRDWFDRVRIIYSNSPETVSPTQQHVSVFPIPARLRLCLSQIGQSRFPELFSRSVDRPPAYRLGQRPPPQSV
jgi:hypothetical protein